MRGLALSLIVLASAPLARSSAAPQAVRLLVVVHEGVELERIDDNGLRAIYMRKRHFWPDGTRIIPLNYAAGHALRAAFDDAVLGFNPEQSARYWIDQRIRSGIQPSVSVASEVMLLKVVAELPGSIGYAPEGTAIKGSRVVARIEGGRVLAP